MKTGVTSGSSPYVESKCCLKLGLKLEVKTGLDTPPCHGQGPAKLAKLRGNAK